MRKQLWLLFWITILLLLPIACDNAPQKPVAPEQSPNMTEDEGQEVIDRRIMTSQFSVLAQEVDGVRNASVIITNQDANGNVVLLSSENKTAEVDFNDDSISNYRNTTASNDNIVVLVGLDVDDQIKKEAINGIKGEIINKIKAADNNVSEVLVTSDPQTVDKIKQIAAKIIQEEPVENYDEEVRKLTEEIKL